MKTHDKVWVPRSKTKRAPGYIAAEINGVAMVVPYDTGHEELYELSALKPRTKSYDNDRYIGA